MKLQIITRGSVREGLGHLLRTRTFAKSATPAHQVEVVAIVEPELENVLGELKCPVRFVREDAGVVPFIQDAAPDALVFDTTRLAPEVFAAVSASARLTASISPVFEHLAAVDMLFTRNARFTPLPNVQIFGGLRYAIFNDHCGIIDAATHDRALARPDLPIAIAMGGSDAANKTLAVLRALAAMPEPTTIWVLLGEGYAHSYEALVDVVRGDQRHEIILAKASRSMWQVMSNCALAVLAGGLTTVEAIHAGLPTINLFERPEHHAMLDELFEQGICLNGGLFSEESLTTMVETLRRLNHNRDELRAIRRRTRGLTDRRGAHRVLEEIERWLAREDGAEWIGEVEVPLTPALSPSAAAREKRPAPSKMTKRNERSKHTGLVNQRRAPLPLPRRGGEGRGEGATPVANLNAELESLLPEAVHA